MIHDEDLKSYLVMKTAAMGRGKAKDAYDIYFLIKHYHGGIESLAKKFESCADLEIIQEMLKKLSGKFASENHAGSVDVSDFEEILDDEELAMLRRDAYEQVQALIAAIAKYQNKKIHNQMKAST